jgi:hypothetical protein
MSLFDDAIKAADIKVSLHRLDVDLEDGESVKTSTGLAIEKTCNGLSIHENNRIIHIDKALYGHLFVECDSYSTKSLPRFESFLSKHKNSPEIASILTYLLELMKGSEATDQIYNLLKHKYDAVHVIISEENKISITGELPQGCEVTVKRK